MEMDPNPPSFNIPMSVQPLDLGADYAKGMTAGQAAGESLGKGISAAFDVANRNRNADDTLKAMTQTGILRKDAYAAVAGKALGAKEAMLGMYAGQWIAQQAQNRELQKIGYTGQTEVDVAHAKLLDTVSAVKSGYGAAAGVNLGKLPLGMGQGGAANQQVQLTAAMQAARGTAPQAVAVGAAQPIQRALPAATPPNLGGTPANPTPLGSTSITNPLAAQQAAKAQQMPITIGAPLSGKDPIPAGWQLGSLRGQNGIMESDGKTFHPMQ